MRDLHVVALSEDGRHVVLATRAGTASGEFRVALDERLTAAVRGELAAPGRDAPPSISPRDIQARLRDGETAEQIAADAGVPLSRVERYAGPVLAELDRMVTGARAAAVTRPRLGASALPLGEAVEAHLAEVAHLAEGSVRWTARRSDLGRWVVEVSWTARGRRRTAGWHYDPTTREVAAVDGPSAVLGHVEADAVPAAASGRARRPAAPAPARPGTTRTSSAPPAARPGTARTSSVPPAARPGTARTPTAQPAAGGRSSSGGDQAASGPSSSSARPARPATSGGARAAGAAGPARPATAAGGSGSRPTAPRTSPATGEPAAPVRRRRAAAPPAAPPAAPAAADTAPVRRRGAAGGADATSSPPVTATGRPATGRRAAVPPVAARPAPRRQTTPRRSAVPSLDELSATAAAGEPDDAAGTAAGSAVAPAAERPAAAPPPGPPVLRVVPPAAPEDDSPPAAEDDSPPAAEPPQAPAARRAAGQRGGRDWADVLMGGGPAAEPHRD